MLCKVKHKDHPRKKKIGNKEIDFFTKSYPSLEFKNSFTQSEVIFAQHPFYSRKKGISFEVKASK